MGVSSDAASLLLLLELVTENESHDIVHTMHLHCFKATLEQLQWKTMCMYLLAPHWPLALVQTDDCDMLHYRTFIVMLPP